MYFQEICADARATGQFSKASKHSVAQRVQDQAVVACKMELAIVA
jgi:hypothetical protein